MAEVRSGSIETVLLAKAAAMVLMVSNHARLSQALFDVPALYGGLNAMLVLSGISMASHAFERDTRQTLRAFARFGWRLAWPCLAVALVWDTIILALGARAVTPFRYVAELALFSNWLSTHKLALFPIWYVQALVQLLVGLGLLFAIADLTPRIRRAPVVATGALLALALTAALISYAQWDTSALEDRLPHLLAWNFLLGWLIWAARREREVTSGTKLALSAVLLIAAAVMYLPTGASNGLSRAWWMSALLLPVIWWRRVTLPAPLIVLVHLVAQSVFMIFILHFYVFGLIELLFARLSLASPIALALVKLVAGLVIPVLCWAWFAACTRVWQRRAANRLIRSAISQPVR